jgi:phage terminase large subunit-like protein
MGKSLMEQIALLPPEEQKAVLSDMDMEQLVWDWSSWARPEQVAPEGIDWSVWLVMAGRGFGKTRLAAEWVREMAKYTNDGQRRFALVARTAADVRDVIVEGEALALNTKIATPTGFVAMADVKVGDTVIGGDGNPCKVTQVFPVLNNRPCYKLDISGTEVIADANHKWLTSTHVERNYEQRMPNTYQGVRTTEELYNTQKTLNGYSVSNHGVRIAAVVGKDASLPVGPYTLGVWLGDGTAKSATITSHTDDQPEVRFRIESEGFTTTDNKTIYTFGVTDGLNRALKSNNLIKNKHIPELYFHSSIDQRMSLLQGLIDSDGSVSKRGQIEFDNTNKTLINDVARLVSTLGIKHGGVKIRLGSRQFTASNGKTYTASEAYRITFTTSLPVASLTRKAGRLKKYRSEEKWRYVKSITPTESRPVRCITVDSPDHTFLITESYIKTHNSGIINISPPSERPHYEPSKRRLTWPNGNTASLFTADEPDGLRGPQFTHAWGDEIAAWRQTPDAAGMTAFDNLRVGTRLGANPQMVVTTTPKRVPILYKLIEESKNTKVSSSKVIITKGSTLDNAGNLSGAYLDTITGVYEGTQLAQQELYGEMLDDIEGALWTIELIDKARELLLPPSAPLRCIGVDPSVAENPRDECGIVVCASTADRDLYKRQAWVMEDASIHGSPEVWANKVVEMARKWGCPVVAEVNQGGALVRNAINAIDPNVKVLEVHSKYGKALRAEPVVLAYEQSRVHHVNYLPDLESQMFSWIPGETRGSPDRVDALVHALTALMIKPPQGFHGGRLTAKSPSARRIPQPKGPGGRIFTVR